ncbi:MAG: efflux RND transporter permease subunit [Acidimicrobiia bacterium]|nr:efflux RND transporter permease subunit [Acidimicrobiia bacterium]
MWLADVSIRRPVFAVMLIGALVTLGWVALDRVPLDLFPRIEFPVVTVTTVLEGATPQTVETEVTEVLEEEISNLAGLDHLLSQSSEGLSTIFVWFELEVDAEAAVQNVRDKVALARRHLPPEIEPPIVDRIDPDAAPILSVMIAGDRSVRELTHFAEDVVKDRLQRVQGVGSVKLVGGRDREIRIWLDAYRLRSYALSAEDVIRAVQTEHAELPGGRLEAADRTAEFSFRTLGEVESPEEFGEIIVAQRQGGPIRIRDVARVEDGLEDERTYAELDGVPGVSLEVRRQSGENTVEVARAVKAEVEGLAGSLPPGIRMGFARDVSRFIESSVRDVYVDIVLGAFLAMLVTLAFLRNLRSTLIVATAIPTSIVATFFLFYTAGFTINIISLMAVSISIGLLIDDAIVVLEAIHRRIEAGERPLEAAARGTQEVGLAVIAATAAIAAVFVPIAFMRGMIGRFFYEYGLTVTFAVAVSLLVAFTLTPMLSSRLLRREEHHGRTFELLEQAYTRLEEIYARMLRLALVHRAAVVALGIATIVAGVLLARAVPLAFDTHSDRSEVEAIIELPLGTGIERTKAVVHEVQQALRSVEQVTSVFATVGGGSQGRIDEASFYVRLTPKQERDVGMQEVMEELRGVLRGAAPDAKRVGVNEIPWIASGGFSAFNVQYTLQGPELDRLEALSHALADAMRASGTFVDTMISYETGRPEVQASVDRRRAADQGVSLRTLAQTLRATVGGVDVATYEEGGDRYDVRVRLEEEQRDDLAELGLIQVRARDGRLTDLENVASLGVASGPVQIDREDRNRKVDVFANTRPGVALGDAVKTIDSLVAQIALPPGYVGRHRGWGERMQDSFESVKFAFGLALLSIYMILASQFNSFTQPAVIMLTAPLSFAGAFAALAATGAHMSLFAQIAFLALMGLVMKNGILLVDYANQLRSLGQPSKEAMLQAGPVRLRPVLMTALSTVFGMLPVALSRADGAEWRNPMGILAVGGMLSSTFLTLLIVPVVYTLVDDLRPLPARIGTRSLELWRTRRRPAGSPAPSDTALEPGASLREDPR